MNDKNIKSQDCQGKVLCFISLPSSKFSREDRKKMTEWYIDLLLKLNSRSLFGPTQSKFILCIYYDFMQS